MCGMLERAASWISRRKRSTLTPARHLGRQHLDHDLAAERRLLGEEHPRHAAATELALDAVGIAKRGLELVAQVRRGVPPVGRVLECTRAR